MIDEKKPKLAKWIKSTFCSFKASESGNIAIIGAVAILPMIMAAGAAVDYSTAYNVSTKLQDIADSAALAGASRFNKHGATTTDIEQTVRTFITASLQEKNIFSSHLSSPNIEINQKDLEVSFTIMGGVKTAFLSAAHIDNIDVKTHARAKAKIKSENVCVLALAKKSSNSIYMAGVGEVIAPDCTFWSNSGTKGQAMKFQGAGSVVAAGYCAVGDHAIQNFSVTPTPKDYCDPYPNPLAKWIPPAVPNNCDYGEDAKGRLAGTTYNEVGGVTLSPGRYCGNTAVSAGDLNLEPGEYFFTDGALKLNTQGSITGKDVYIHLSETLSSYTISTGGNVHLTRRDDPDLKKVLLYKAPAWNKANKKSSVKGGSDIFIDGVIYTPKDVFVLAGNTKTHAIKPKMTLIADMIEIQGGARLEISPDPDFATESAESFVWLVE